MNSSMKGPSLPFRFDPDTGGLVTSNSSVKTRENLKHLLLTNLGERLMLRTYGGGVRQLLHENINDGLIGVAKYRITKALLEFEPRIVLQDISIIPNEGELLIRIEYLEEENSRLETVIIPIG